MKKIIFLIIFFTFFITAYTLLVPIKIYFKDTYQLKNSFNTTDISNIGEDDGYYYTDKERGVFSIKNGIISKFTCLEEEYLQANSYGFVTYQDGGNYITLYNGLGVKIKDIGTVARPYISDDLPFFYTIDSNGYGFALYTMNGDKMYKEISQNSMITSISLDKYGNSLVSNMDGDTVLYSATGEIIFNVNSAYSSIKFVKSSVIDKNEHYLAICSGLKPEVIEIFMKKTGTRHIKFDTETNFRRKNFISFNREMLFYEGVEKIIRYDIKKKRYSDFVFFGELKSVKFDNNGNIMIVSNHKNTYYLNIYSQTNIKLFYKEFDSIIDNVNFIDNSKFFFRIKHNIVVFEKNISA